MLVTTTDPITGKDVTDLENAPFTIEGQGETSLKIYFESEQSKQEYMVISMEEIDSSSIDIYNKISDNETMGTIN